MSQKRSFFRLSFCFVFLRKKKKNQLQNNNWKKTPKIIFSSLPLFSTESVCGNINYLFTPRLDDFIYFHLWKSHRGMNLSEQRGGEEQGRPWQLDVRSFHNQGQYRTSDSLYLNPSLTHTHTKHTPHIYTHSQVGKLTPLFSPTSAVSLIRWSLLLRGEMCWWKYPQHLLLETGGGVCIIWSHDVNLI